MAPDASCADPESESSMIDQDGGRCDQADGFELFRIVETASVYRDGRRLGVVGVDGGRLVPVEGGLDVFAVPELVAERIAREHRPRTFAASVTGGDGVFWEWFYS
jgi:hypothetical protein